MVVRLEGKIDGNIIIFRHVEGDVWETTIPKNLSGIYIVELTAYDEVGNKGFATKYLITVDTGGIKIKIQPFLWRAELCDCHTFSAISKISEYISEIFACPKFESKSMLSEYYGEIINWG